MTDTLNKKMTEGQQFLAALEVAKKDKSKIFTLLQAAVEKNRPNSSEKVDYNQFIGKMTDFDARAALEGAKASVNAQKGAHLFPEDYFYLAAKVYKEERHGETIADFKKNFRMHVQHEAVRAAVKQKAGAQEQIG